MEEARVSVSPSQAPSTGQKDDKSKATNKAKEEGNIQAAAKGASPGTQGTAGAEAGAVNKAEVAASGLPGSSNVGSSKQGSAEPSRDQSSEDLPALSQVSGKESSSADLTDGQFDDVVASRVDEIGSETKAGEHEAANSEEKEGKAHAVSEPQQQEQQQQNLEAQRPLENGGVPETGGDGISLSPEASDAMSAAMQDGSSSSAHSQDNSSEQRGMEGAGADRKGEVGSAERNHESSDGEQASDQAEQGDGEPGCMQKLGQVKEKEEEKGKGSVQEGSSKQQAQAAEEKHKAMATSGTGVVAIWDAQLGDFPPAVARKLRAQTLGTLQKAMVKGRKAVWELGARRVSALLSAPASVQGSANQFLQVREAAWKGKGEEKYVWCLNRQLYGMGTISA